MLFGISSWIAINGVWVELPLLVATLPEGWALPSYLSVIIQVANVGPLLYSLLRFRLRRRRAGLDVLVVYAMLVTGATACLLSGLLWQRTSFIGGTEHSTAFFGLLFFIALVDCTSSVVYVPFTARFRHTYLVSYMIGEGLSGLLPSLVALIQGVGGNADCVNGTKPDGTVGPVPEELKPLFAVDDFFYFLCGMMTVSCVTFALLQNLPQLAPSREPACSVNSADSLGESSTSLGSSGPRRRVADPAPRPGLTLPLEVPLSAAPPAGLYQLLHQRRAARRPVLLCPAVR